ncbi:FtsX-like permease family protein [Frankia sp. CNm7]|uniref:Cell division protein FtsX n=1 Tax=Frankia nepalensis TaxID=1836974 RepID=A0A937R529_9ACTN|nr:permease-like cell division protein FtsX [Frankia nepalensis]MBL7499115.1 FtsX-like permease family protein [Frankia nepalensis]MBL7513872.1 FtsX-like permease family protein [Frankia nepalensis]MBL7519332.1 FtsX-like permease family protein [Frankia nepalensis]MBL7625908.1 FtsX-like permease family protein [Frankia nepalensis]
MRIGPLLAILGAGLRRNLAVTSAVVITAAVCLGLLGAGLLLRAEVRTVDRYLLDQLEVVIDLTDDITPAQRAALVDDLDADPAVLAVRYEDKRQVYERFRRDFRASPDVVAGVGPADLPAALRLRLVDPRAGDELLLAYTGRDGVEAVRDQRALLKPLYRVLDGFSVAAFTLAAVQAAASSMLIYTMIRVSAHARRRETAIMRLVGATNAAIRAPFVLESALSGLAGGLVAAGALVVTKIFLVDGRFARQTTFPLFGWDAVWLTSGAVLLIGTLAAASMAHLALRRHLHV